MSLEFTAGSLYSLTGIISRESHDVSSSSILNKSTLWPLVERKKSSSSRQKRGGQSVLCHIIVEWAVVWLMVLFLHVTVVAVIENDTELKQYVKLNIDSQLFKSFGW